MLLSYKKYLLIKSALIKYFVDNQIKADRYRPKQFLCDCNLCRNLKEAKLINDVLLDNKSNMLTVIDKIIYIRYSKYDTLYETQNGDIQRINCKHFRNGWNIFKKLYKV